MAYIGRSVDVGMFEKQVLTADSSTTTFTLTFAVGSANSLLVVYGGVIQEPAVAYSVSGGGQQIVFSEAPATGTTTYIIYLGKQLTTPRAAGQETTKQTFAGDGSTVTFTLTDPPVVPAGIMVFVDGILQREGSGNNYVSSGSTITFTSAPDSSAEIDVYTLVKEKVSIDTVADGSITSTKLAASHPTWNSAGDFTFLTGSRIKGDFSNATLANRVAFQNSTTNASTSLTIIPNGTGPFASANFINNSDPTNASTLNIQCNATDVRLQSSLFGSGTYLPMTFYTGGSERVRIDTSGNLLLGSSSSYAGKFQSWGAVTANAASPNISAIDTTSMASGVGGELAFFGQYTSGSYAYFGSIKGIKENGTNNNTACALTFFTRPDATAPIERMRIDSSGRLIVGATAATGSNQVEIQTALTNALLVQTGSTSSSNYIADFRNGANISALTIFGNATSTFVTTVGVGQATPSTSGSGITFPATQSASSNANTLDDYEEGTWTPSLGGTATYTTLSGSYIKIGRMVTVKATIVVNLIGTGSNNAISGLPFTCNALYGLPVGYFDTINTSVINLSARTIQSSTTMAMTGVASAATAITDSFNTFRNSTYVEFSGTYFTT